jgi:phosphatidate cytidylyltransferase
MNTNLFNWFARLHLQPPTARLLTGFVTVLALFSLAGWLAAKHTKPESRLAKALQQFNKHLRGMWSIVVVFSIALLTGGVGSILVFAGCSFLLLREFITITPTRKADQRALFWVFFAILPLQYIILGCNWYGLFAIFIPVYAFLFLPIRIAAQADFEKFLERTARIQWALMICVYCVSHAPALIRLTIPGQEGAGARLLLFLCIVVEANGAAHEFADILFGRHFLIPKTRNSRTAEGLFAGMAASAGLGAMMSSVTPMTVFQAIFIAVLVGLLGSAGQLCLAMIRAERGREGVVVVHRDNEMLGRTISLCFAAPVFFHIIRLTFTGGELRLF